MCVCVCVCDMLLYNLCMRFTFTWVRGAIHIVGFCLASFIFSSFFSSLSYNSTIRSKCRDPSPHSVPHVIDPPPPLLA